MDNFKTFSKKSKKRTGDKPSPTGSAAPNSASSPATYSTNANGIITTGDRVDESLLLDEAKVEEWSPPLAGEDIQRHLGKNHLKGITGDEDYIKHVEDGVHFPVFRVNRGDDNLLKVKVGNTAGIHHVEYVINRAGTVQKKTVFAHKEGLHPNLHWAPILKWDIKDEMEKAKKK